MNNWIVLRSFSGDKKCWFVRVNRLQQAAEQLGLELSTCECNGVPNIIQEFLNITAPATDNFVEL